MNNALMNEDKLMSFSILVRSLAYLKYQNVSTN